MICKFFLRVAACKIVEADLSLRHILYFVWMVRNKNPVNHLLMTIMMLVSAILDFYNLLTELQTVPNMHCLDAKKQKSFSLPSNENNDTDQHNSRFLQSTH